MASTAPILIYKASAGSGKTFQLTYHYILMLFQSDYSKPHKRILAVTFTNKATAEMKSRIIHELFKLSCGEEHLYREWLKRDVAGLSDDVITKRTAAFLRDLLSDYSGFRVQTIDGFFQQLVRAFSREIGLQGSYQVELENKLALETGIDNLFNQLDKKENAQLLNWLTDFAQEIIDQGGYWDIRSKIQDLGMEIFTEMYSVHADELTTLMNNKDFLKAYKQKLNLIYKGFETKVEGLCNRCQDLIRSYGLQVEDFKGGKTSFVSYFSYEKLKANAFKPTATFVKSIGDVTQWYTKNSAKKSEIEQVYNAGLGTAACELGALIAPDSKQFIFYKSAREVLRNIYVLGILADIDNQIREDSKEGNSMLISSTNEFLKRIIDGSETPFVYERTGVTIDHYMIDEFQDTSRMQWNNFIPLLSNSIAQNYNNLLVGDVKQSIYRWRNSDWHILHQDVEKEFEKRTEIHSLDTNFRSDHHIVEFNNEIFDFLVNGIASHFQGHEEEIKQVYGTLEQEIKKEDNKGAVGIWFIPNENKSDYRSDAMNHVAEQIHELLDKNYLYSDIAILVRTKEEAATIALRMLEEGFPVLSNEALMVQNSPSVQLLLAALRYLKRPDNLYYRALFGILYLQLNNPTAISDEIYTVISGKNKDYTQWEIDLFGEEQAAMLQQIRHFSLFKMSESLIVWLNLQNRSNDVPFIQAFQDAVHDFEVNVSSDINSFMTYWDENGAKLSISAPEHQNAIRIMTIHKSKGLEFKAVFIPFCDWKFSTLSSIIWVEPKEAPFNELPVVPLKYNKELEFTIFSEDYLKEKMSVYLDVLNVGYVAFTRAKSALYLCAPIKSKPDEISFPALLMDYVSTKPGWDNNDLVYRYGEIECLAPHEGDKDSNQASYVSDNIESVNSRLKLRFKNQKYWGLSETSPLEIRREYGNIMHELLGRIDVQADAQAAIDSILHDGIITDDESPVVKQHLDDFFAIPQTQDWFSGHYQVLKEAEIITPQGITYRPDRVMIDGKRVIIVDYKFGDYEVKKYRQQVAGYMKLVREMGYSPVGYLCYVSLKKVEQVELAN